MKSKKLLPWIAAAVAAAFLVGAYVLFNGLFPKARAIRLPEEKDILSVSVGVNHDEPFDVSGVDLPGLLRLLGDAKPTREQSLNDYPGSSPFYQIALRTSERQYRYFIYKNSSGRACIEIPYEGVYIAGDAVLDFAAAYFEG